MKASDNLFFSFLIHTNKSLYRRYGVKNTHLQHENELSKSEARRKMAARVSISDELAVSLLLARVSIKICEKDDPRKRSFP